MDKKRSVLWVVVLVILLLSTIPVVAEQTWQLQRGGGLKAVSAADEQDRYQLAVAAAKRLVDEGKAGRAKQAFDQLKKDFPEIAGPDLDAFVLAELLFAEGKFTKAMRSYEEFLDKFPASELYEAALEREFAVGMAYLSGQKKQVLKIFRIKSHATGEKIMDKITNRVGDAPIGQKAAVAVAQSREERGKFADAYQKWSEISSQWPTGEMGRKSLLAMARCKHASYRGPKYAAADLISAKSYYENYSSRYPEDARSKGIDKKLKQIEEQLAYKQFSVGRYYQETSNTQAANLYYQLVIDEWPGTTAAKMAEEMMTQKSKVQKKNDK